MKKKSTKRADKKSAQSKTLGQGLVKSLKEVAASEKAKAAILKKYTALAKKMGEYPSRSDMLSVDVSRDKIRHYFGKMDDLKQQARDANPSAFEKIIDLDIFNDSAHADLVKKVKNCKTFVIQTVVAGGPVHEELAGAVKTFLKAKKGMHLIIPADYALQNLDPDLMADPSINIVFRTLHLNSNLCVDPIKIDPKQVDPVLGLSDLAHAETVIIGSPKQRRVSVSNSNKKLSRMIQATGALTKPNYVPRSGIPRRKDTLAQRQHRMGGVIVEIVDNKLYHFRHFEMCKDGSFNDLFFNYSEDGVKFAGCEAIVQGDKHVGDTDPAVNAAVDEMCKIGKPRYRMEHDFFNGRSVNPHGEDDLIERAQLALKGELNLERELKECAEEIKRVRKLNSARTHVIVESNHNEWIMRYLKKGKFTDENRLIATKLQAAVIEGKQPFAAAMEMFGILPGPDLLFLEIDDDFIVEGVALGNHGHLGANGKKNPGAKGMYKAYGKCSFGHGHHGEIWHDAHMVGTSTHMKLSYNKGASSWDNSQEIVYAGGTRQLVNVIKGKWRP